MRRPPGNLALALRERVDLPVAYDLENLLLDRLADPVQFLGATVERQLGDRGARLADARRGLTVGADAKLITGLEFDEVCEEFELRRERGVSGQTAVFGLHSHLTDDTRAFRPH